MHKRRGNQAGPVPHQQPVVERNFRKIKVALSEV